MTTGTPELLGSLLEKLILEEPLPMVEEIMNTPQILLVEEQAAASSPARGLHRSTLAGTLGTQANHLLQPADRSTHHQHQE